MTGRKRKRGGPSDRAENKELVIVESPAKARTINRYLGSDYEVMASVGHVRDLPGRNPKGVKNPVPGVDLENDFKPTYQIIKGKEKTVRDLKRAAKDASGVWLATDMDREGEAIAWHLTQALAIGNQNVKRVLFNAITKGEVAKAFRNPRSIDLGKVNAQQARRILDRIVGYQVSPLLWKKVGGGLSAGRVQSVAVRLVVERDREIEAFVPEEYWRIIGYFTPEVSKASGLAEEWMDWLANAPEGQNLRHPHGHTAKEKNAWLGEHGCFAAELTEIDGGKFSAKDRRAALEVATRAGFVLDQETEKEDPRAKEAARHVVTLEGHLSGGPQWQVKSVRSKKTRSRPFAPFITSTLQQTAANQLGMSAHTTMRLAQDLYEGMQVAGMGSVGLITYMRTDSTHLTADAIGMAREFIDSQFGGSYLPSRANVFTSSNKSAQEAHEAIRPTDVNLTPERVRSSLSNKHYKLYKLIWERFVACQMTPAQWEAKTILISGQTDKGELVFRATGRVLVFDGHYRVVGVPQSDEPVLPSMRKGRDVAAIQMEPIQRFTSPRPRYTEASLVKKLEAEGIGRPSTYAQIIQVIQDRKYVEKIQNRFRATDTGRVVTDKLTEAFPKILEVGYTREMERQLDEIEEKKRNWVEMLRNFYGPFQENLEVAYENMGHAKAETREAPYTCPECGGPTVYRFGKNGRFLSCARYPECKYAAPIDREGKPTGPEETDIACPKCGSPMLLRTGRYGRFLSCTRYPDCDGIVNLDKKGGVRPPKAPPLLTDLSCPKCGAPMYLRRGSKGPWLSCSKFPKCRGRLSWTSLPDEIKEKWEEALEAHEKAHPQPVIRKLDGTAVKSGYVPQIRGEDENEQ